MQLSSKVLSSKILTSIACLFCKSFENICFVKFLRSLPLILIIPSAELPGGVAIAQIDCVFIF